MAADGKEAAGSKNFVRRTWDTEEYEKKANERAVKEAEGDDTGIIGPDGKKAPAPYKDAPEGVAGPEGSKRAYLQRREEDLNLEARLGKKQLVTDSTPLSEAGGYWCDLCQCTLKDSTSYLDHKNGKKHQRRLGMTMRVERVGVDAVKEKLEKLKQLKAGSGALTMDTDDKYAAQAMSTGKSGKSDGAGGHRSRADFDKQSSGTDSSNKRARTDDSNGSTLASSSAPSDKGKAAPPVAEEREDDGIDPEMAAMMGFGSFGGSKKR